MEARSVSLLVGLFIIVVLIAFGLTTQSSDQLRSQALIPDQNPADLTGDSIVDSEDLRVVANSWHTSSGDPNFSSLADLNQDGFIDESDTAAVSAAWTTAP